MILLLMLVIRRFFFGVVYLVLVIKVCYVVRLIRGKVVFLIVERCFGVGIIFVLFIMMKFCVVLILVIVVFLVMVINFFGLIGFFFYLCIGVRMIGWFRRFEFLMDGLILIIVL